MTKSNMERRAFISAYNFHVPVHPLGKSGQELKAYANLGFSLDLLSPNRQNLDRVFDSPTLSAVLSVDCGRTD